MYRTDLNLRYGSARVKLSAKFLRQMLKFGDLHAYKYHVSEQPSIQC